MRSFGELARVGVECTGTYGAGSLSHLQQAGTIEDQIQALERARYEK
jgi:transposase